MQNTRFSCRRWVVGLAAIVALSFMASPVFAQRLFHRHRSAQPYCPTPMPHVVEPSDAHPKDLPKADKDKKQPQLPEQPIDFEAAPVTAADLGGATGISSLGMLGRGDFANRFNMFDNLSAIPRSQVWFGYQYLDEFNTGLLSVPGSLPAATATSLTTPRSLHLYRFGAEIALNDRISVLAQHEYIVSRGTDSINDAWSNPLFAVKAVLLENCDTVISGVFGIQPQTSTQPFELREVTTRLYPGLLIYRALSDDLFFQGGFQFGLATNNDLANTFDYALGLGYWLYRDPAIGGGCGRCGGCNDGGCGSCGGCAPRSGLAAIVPMVEIYGKHVIANEGAIPYNVGGRGDPAFASFRAAEEDVYDITFGTRILFHSGFSIGLGLSFPLTSDEVREAEFLSTFNYAF